MSWSCWFVEDALNRIVVVVVIEGSEPDVAVEYLNVDVDG